jgi:hypothetical protein
MGCVTPGEEEEELSACKHNNYLENYNIGY